MDAMLYVVVSTEDVPSLFSSSATAARSVTLKVSVADVAEVISTLGVSVRVRPCRMRAAAARTSGSGL